VGSSGMFSNSGDMGNYLHRSDKFSLKGCIGWVSPL
jgi:hypothetical protein